jgi:hypothetical protein
MRDMWGRRVGLEWEVKVGEIEEGFSRQQRQMMAVGRDGRRLYRFGIIKAGWQDGARSGGRRRNGRCDFRGYKGQEDRAKARREFEWGGEQVEGEVLESDDRVEVEEWGNSG